MEGEVVGSRPTWCVIIIKKGHSLHLFAEELYEDTFESRILKLWYEYLSFWKLNVCHNVW